MSIITSLTGMQVLSGKLYCQYYHCFDLNAGVDSCSDRLLNYCDVTATCNMTSYGGFECVCQKGFIDTSPNRIEASGERCTCEY